MGYSLWRNFDDMHAEQLPTDCDNFTYVLGEAVELLIYEGVAAATILTILADEPNSRGMIEATYINLHRSDPPRQLAPDRKFLGSFEFLDVEIDPKDHPDL